eukprot:1470431-Rhodomonas_salina.4
MLLPDERQRMVYAPWKLRKRGGAKLNPSNPPYLPGTVRGLFARREQIASDLVSAVQVVCEVMSGTHVGRAEVGGKDYQHGCRACCVWYTLLPTARYISVSDADDTSRHFQAKMTGNAAR